MLKFFVNEQLTVATSSDNSSYVGIILAVEGPRLQISFDVANDLKVGDQLTCSVSHDGSYTVVVAEVVEVEAESCSFWMVVQRIMPGVERARRTVAPGTIITIRTDNEEILGSVCDVSESGLRIRTLGLFDVGLVTNFRMKTQVGEIFFLGRIARVVHCVENESFDIGVQITEIGKLDRARYNHFVDGLLRKAKKVA
jgi:hypothetical protein